MKKKILILLLTLSMIATALPVVPASVRAAQTNPDAYLQKVLDSLKWDFKLLQPVCGEDTNILTKFQALLQKRGFDDVTVTIHSTADESLISQNGKIHYPPIPDGSFATGKQVQVFFDLTVEDTTVVYPTSDMYALLVPWNSKEQVTEALRHSADTVLAEDVLRGANDSLSAVSSNLTLPSCLRGDKYSFAWITWESSDSKHLSISDENRKGTADALYEPYVGAVVRDAQQRDITLTATITNPSTDITIYRIFSVTVLPLSEGEVEQSLDQMTKILSCYTPDKLTDFATGQKLDPAAVTHDIQLVIPRNVVTQDELQQLDYGPYWDYWNYRFTVQSSDTDVIDVNSFRAYVYRPLGKDHSADRTVTLTVTMESKTDPSLSVSKELAVTVSYLGRDELNGALALMDQAKADYTAHLLGTNTDAYSVIDDLTPFQELVWNEDHTGTTAVSSISERRNTGIVVDELPGWEEQEDWRLFHSSDRDLLANETLILSGTPAEDTFVKIESVLTDEQFGGYYTKFQNADHYDAEALEKFRQLFQQPVSAYVMVVGSGNYTESFAAAPYSVKESSYGSVLTAYKREIDSPIRVSFTLLGLNGEPIIPKTTDESFTKGATVFDVFKKILAEHSVPYEAKGSRVTSINGLSEYDYGKRSGWMYTIGNVYVDSYMNAQTLSGEEEIVVKYVTDYTLANGTTHPDTDDEDFGGGSSGADPASGDAAEDPDDSGETDATPGQETGTGDSGDTAARPAKKGTVLKDAVHHCKVRVASSSGKAPAVLYLASTQKKARRITIPARVTIGGIRYHVTGIAPKALKNKKSVVTVTIGTQVSSIGNKAFQNCVSLRKIIVRTSKLTKKTVGSDILRGTRGTLTIKVPSRKRSAYAACFRNRGNDELNFIE